MAIGDQYHYNLAVTHRGAIDPIYIGMAEIECCFLVGKLGTRVPEPDNAGVGIEFGLAYQLSLKPVPLTQGESEQ